MVDVPMTVWPANRFAAPVEGSAGSWAAGARGFPVGGAFAHEALGKRLDLELTPGVRMLVVAMGTARALPRPPWVRNAPQGGEERREGPATVADVRSEKALFSRGQLGPPEFFTKRAWIKTLVAQAETFGNSISNVIFEPGARNNWHSHPAGRVLLVTEGRGYYREKGKPARPVSRGDGVVVRSGMVHWYGAAQDGEFAPIATTNYDDRGMVEWMQAVTDQEYAGLGEEGGGECGGGPNTAGWLWVCPAPRTFGRHLRTR